MRLYVNRPFHVVVRCAGEVIEESEWPRDRALAADIGSTLCVQDRSYRVTGYKTPKVPGPYPLRELAVVPLSEGHDGPASASQSASQRPWWAFWTRDTLVRTAGGLWNGRRMRSWLR